MQCDFLDWSGGIFGSYYCSKDNKSVDKSTVNTYCDNSMRYRDCPIYKRSSNSSCYLTTCMCNILGFDDNCKTLDSLRSFRENYMRKNEDCLPLLEDYDVVGPIICDKIMKDENKTRTAHVMLIEYITPAINSINNSDYDLAISYYKNMTTDLMDYYGVDKSILSFDNNNTKNKSRVRKMKPCEL